MHNGKGFGKSGSSNVGKYVPERLEDFKIDANGEKYYLVKWCGLPQSKNSWEHRDNLSCYFMMYKIEKIKTMEKMIKNEPMIPELRTRPRRPGIVPFEERSTGFDRGRTPERVIGVSEVSGQLEFLIKWKGVMEADLIPREIANIRCPQIVIKYYEENLTWDFSDMKN
ncbi:chromobox protein homolog 1-like [Harmonia axyridis]|uniref:chromobox protein homolog 1-like n=1 Tax=Harmonia axyridis TaxID=115357 RepID=UPI001E277CA6|nr:chromobox protein homolog 1-like [Harmonia axyridis]